MEFFSISGLLIFACTFIAGFFVLVKDYKKFLNISCSFFSFFISAWGLGFFFAFRSDIEVAALFWFRFLNLIAIFIPFLFIVFVYSYLNILRSKQRIVICGFIGPLVYLLFSLYNPWSFIPSVSNKLGLLWYPDAGSLYFIFPIYYGLLVVLGVYELIKAYFLAEKIIRKQLAYLFLAVSIGFLGGATTFPLLYNIPVYPVGVIGVIVMVIMLAYAITKHELFDIRVALPRTVAYGLVGLLLLGSILIVYYFLLDFPHIQIAVLMSLSVFWAFMGHRLRKFIQTPLEEKWITSWYDPQLLVNNIAISLSPVLDKDEVFQRVGELLRSGIHIKNWTYYIKEKDANSDSVYYVNRGRDHEEVILKFSHPFIKYFEENQGVVSGKNFINDLKESSEVYGVDKKGVGIPFYSDNKLFGVILLGEKISEDSYTKSDMGVFQTVQHQVFIILDRIKPYEKAKEGVKKGQQKQLVLEQELVDANEHLKEVAYYVTHDLKNEVNGLKLFVDYSIEGKIKDEARNKLSGLFSDMSAEIKGHLKAYANNKKVDVNELIKEICEEMKVHLKHKKLSLDINEKAEVRIEGSYDELYILFKNLIENAINYSFENGVIEIELGGKLPSSLEGFDATRGMVVVRDFGMGIGAEEVDKVFEHGYRATGTKDKVAGTGLGLSMCKKIVDRMNGKIWVESEVGKGSCFGVGF